MSEDWRARFDVEVTFGNGGRLEAQGFRLDVAAEAVSDAQLAEQFVRQLGLLMVDTVRITNRVMLREAHKGTTSIAAKDEHGAVRRLVELSHVIRNGMVTYPGLPGPDISDHLTREASRARYALGTEFHIGRISMVANTGTYLDTPAHRFADGPDLSGVGLDALAALEGLVVRVVGSSRRAIGPEALYPNVVRGRAVLVHTGWDRQWGTPEYGVDAPFLTGSAAEWLAREGAALVGIDSVNIDDVDDMRRPAHTALLAAGIPIVEHLRGVEQLPPTGFRFHAAPPLVEGLGTFPVRAYAVVETGR